MPGLAPEVEGRLRGDVEQRARLEGALHVHGDVLERVLPVVGDVLVELAVLVLGDLVLGPGPDRLHRVQRVAPQANGVRDEVRVLLDDVAEDVLVGVVAEPVLLVLGLEVERHRRAGDVTLCVLEGVALARRLPAGGRLLAGLARDDRDAVSRHEARVEADAELADQLGRGRRPGLADLLEEGLGARARDRAEVLDQLLAAHADAAVVDAERARLPIELDPDARLGLARGELGPGQRLEAALVERVAGVRDELAQEDLLVAVEGVDHQAQDFAGLGLETQGLGRAAHAGDHSGRRRGGCKPARGAGQG